MGRPVLSLRFLPFCCFHWGATHLQLIHSLEVSVNSFWLQLYSLGLAAIFLLLTWSIMLSFYCLLLAKILFFLNFSYQKTPHYCTHVPQISLTNGSIVFLWVSSSLAICSFPFPILWNYNACHFLLPLNFSKEQIPMSIRKSKRADIM